MLCGGTFVAEDILLTAAHCEITFVEDVIVGSNDLYGRDGSERIPIAQLFPHENYDARTEENDIMLVKLERPSQAELVTLNVDPAVPVDDDPVKVIGFGQTSPGGEVSFELLEVEVETLNWELCSNLTSAFLFEETQMCAGVLAGGRDSCRGDSGGPLLGPNNIQYGLVSFGFSCAEPNKPAFYTRVSSYMDWIRQGICNLSDNPPADCPEPTEPPSIAPAAVETTMPTEGATTAATMMETEEGTVNMETDSPTIGMETETPTDSIQSEQPTPAVSTAISTSMPVASMETLSPTLDRTGSPIASPTEAPVDAPTLTPVVPEGTKTPTGLSTGTPVLTQTVSPTTIETGGQVTENPSGNGTPAPYGGPGQTISPVFGQQGGPPQSSMPSSQPNSQLRGTTSPSSLFLHMGGGTPEPVMVATSTPTTQKTVPTASPNRQFVGTSKRGKRSSKTKSKSKAKSGKKTKSSKRGKKENSSARSTKGSKTNSIRRFPTTTLFAPR